MPNFNARMKPVVNSDGKSNIKIRVTHRGESRFIATEYYIEPKHFDNKSGRVKPSHPLAVDININLQALELTYSRKILKLEARIKTISINELVSFISETDTNGAVDFFSVATIRIAYFRKSGKSSSATILEQTVKKIREYHGSGQLPFVNMQAPWLRGFDAWYCLTGSQNSSAIHLRNIRSLFNIAMDEHNLSQDYYPFRKFKIKTQATIHRDMNPEEIARLYGQQLQGFKGAARDLWMLSFLLVGINFKDLLTVKKSNIIKGRLEYNRAKTGTIFSIKIEPEAQAIIDKYAGRVFMLRFLEDKAIVQVKKSRNTPLYKDITDRVNRELKKIAKKINTDDSGKVVELIDPFISTYYARHSWGTIASRMGVAHDVIREALGHSRTVTDIYINFYTQRIDEANRKIIDKLKSYRPA